MQNTQHVSFNLGFSDSLNKDYVGFGVGYRYFPLDGVEVDLDFDLLLGNEPIIYRVSPGIRYVFYPLQTFIPYVGTFYQYSYIVNMENKGGLGARAGFYTPLGHRTYISYGVSVGELRQCEKAVYGDCSIVQAEFSFSLVF
ncbi:hypothetical protein [Kaarinaea lacus]